jgi:hypothetical protein
MLLFSLTSQLEAERQQTKAHTSVTVKAPESAQPSQPSQPPDGPSSINSPIEYVWSTCGYLEEEQEEGDSTRAIRILLNFNLECACYAVQRNTS